MQAPILNFDNSDTFAHFSLTALMCWPDESERKLYTATFATLEIDNGTVRASKFINRLIALSDIPNPKRSVADLIIKSMAPNKAMEQRWWEYIYMLAETLPPEILPNASPFERFMALCRIPAYREGLRKTYTDYANLAYEELLGPSGGFYAAAHGPGYDRVISEISNACVGHPMLAGLVLTAVARLARNHAEMTASFNRACFVLDESPEVKTSTTTLKSSWPRWRQVAPLWAGTIVENGYLQLDYRGLCAITMDRARRIRAMRYALWFARFATSPRVDVASTTLIPPNEVVRFEMSIDELEPPLPPLAEAQLKAARTYRREIVDTGLRSKSRK